VSRSVSPRPRLPIAVMAAVLALPAVARAVEHPDPSTGTVEGPNTFFGPAEFLEKSYVGNAWPPPNPNPTSFGPSGPRTPHDQLWLILQGEPALHLFFWNPLGRRIAEGERDGNEGHWVFIPSFTLMLKIRFLRTESVPVRTPSYMPRFNFQLIRFSFPWRHDKGASYFSEYEYFLRLAHHSNGQEFCEFEVGQQDGACHDGQPGYFDPKHPDYSKVNLINGSFGTDYLVVGMHHKWVTAVDSFNYARTSYSFGVMGEWDPKGLDNYGGLGGADEDLYGFLRFQVEGELQWLTNRFLWWRDVNLAGHERIAGYAQLIHGTGPGIAPYRVSLEASRTFLHLGGGGVFARFFSGQDDYNIWYVHRIDAQAVFGFIIDFSPPLQFGHCVKTKASEGDLTCDPVRRGFN